MARNDGKAEGGIDRRRALAMIAGGAATAGLAITARGAGLPVLIARPAPMMIALQEEYVSVPRKKGFLARMFDFKNRFWRGLGQVVLGLAGQGLSMAGLRLSSGQDQYAYNQLNAYNQQQGAHGWSPAPNSSVYQLPGSAMSNGMSNSYQDNFQAPLWNAQSQQFVVLTPAAVIALAQLIDVFRYSGRYDDQVMQDVFLPQRVLCERRYGTLPESGYFGRFRSRNGSIEVEQRPAPEPGRPTKGELMVRIENNWGPQDLRGVILTKRPLTVEYPRA